MLNTKDGFHFLFKKLVYLSEEININHCFRSISPAKNPQKISNGSRHGERSTEAMKFGEMYELACAKPPENARYV